MSHPVTATTAQNAAKAAELVASGQTYSQVAKTLHISVRSVQRILSDPLVKQALAQLRLGLRAHALAGAQAIVPAAQAWLREVVEGKTSAKDADALSRALLNLEKVAASASGENKPTFQPAQQVNVMVGPGWVKSKPAQVTVVQTVDAPEAIEGNSPPAIPKELLPAPKPIPRDL